MTAALLASLLILGAGLSLALAPPGGTRRPHALAGEAYLLGAGAAMFVLLSESAAGVAWSRASLLAGLAVIAAIGLAAAIRRGIPPLELPRLGWANLVDLFTLLLLGGHALLATAAPPVESDYLLIWGVKARMFFAARGIDWSYLEAPLNVPAHVDYPLLTTFVYDVHALVNGSWPEEWTGIVTFAFGLAGLLAIRGLLADEVGKLPRAVATAALMPLVFSPYIGLAEGPITAYATVGLLSIRRGIQTRVGGDVVRGAVYLGLAASTKNEGLALIVAAAAAMVAARAARLLPRLWPAVAIPLPWIVLHRLHGVRVDLADSGLAERLLARLEDPLPVIRTVLGHSVGRPLFWIGVVVACALGARRLAGRERFLAVAVALQLLFLIGAYFATPHDVIWHVQTSWDRIVRQLMPSLALLALFALYEREPAV